MKEFLIGKNDSDQRLDRWISKAVPSLPSSLIQKFIRLKRIKVNGKKSEKNVRLNVGDRVSLYINDDFFEKKVDTDFKFIKPNLNIIYEDESIIILNKLPGQLVHPDKPNQTDTLLTNLKSYLYQKHEWDPMSEASFAPSLCNRIDRNTGGLVIGAKTAEALREMNLLIKHHKIEKRYLCVIEGLIKPAQGKLVDQLYKDEKSKKSSVGPNNGQKTKSSITEYKTLTFSNGLSLVECNLITGRFHQIRAQFAAAGFPLLGDLKYGGAKTSDKNRSIQALYAYKLIFNFEEHCNALNKIKNKSFITKDIPFITKYFPKYNIK